MANTFFETWVEHNIVARDANRVAHAFTEDIEATVRATRRMIAESHALIAQAHVVLEGERERAQPLEAASSGLVSSAAPRESDL